MSWWGRRSDLPGLLAVIQQHEPDVVVTDIRMPPTGKDEGIQAAAWLREHRPGVGVVVLTQFTSPRYALALLERGSAGRAYLLKERVASVDESGSTTTAPDEVAASRASPTGVSGDSSAARPTAPAAPTAPMTNARARLRARLARRAAGRPAPSAYGSRDARGQTAATPAAVNAARTWPICAAVGGVTSAQR